MLPLLHARGGACTRRHTIEAHLGIKAGETSADGLFTLTEVECLGACVNAPMIQVNDMFFEDLTPETTVALLDNLKAGKEVVVGPQNGRKNCLGPMGRTSLTGPPPGPYCREVRLAAPPPPCARLLWRPSPRGVRRGAACVCSSQLPPPFQPPK